MLALSRTRTPRRRSTAARILSLSCLLVSLGACACPPHSSAAVRRQMVAAWDFNETGAGPLSDKATGGRHADDLSSALTHEAAHETASEIVNGIARLGGGSGGALFAETSRDLELQGPLTIWMRVRVLEAPVQALPLVHKAGEGSHAYELDLSPAGDDGEHFGIGGAVTYSNQSEGRLVSAVQGERLPVGAWRELALVVRQERAGFVARWYASNRPVAEAPEHWQLVNGPVGLPPRRRILPSAAPFFVGPEPGYAGLGATLEIDEMHVYARGLTLRELSQLEVGMLGVEGHDHDHEGEVPDEEEARPAEPNRDLVRGDRMHVAPRVLESASTSGRARS